jgi:hypothetical protein
VTASVATTFFPCACAPWANPARPHNTDVSRRITVPNTAVVIVCLPKATPTDQLATTAIARLASSTPLTNASPAGHFPVTIRLRRGSLVQPWHDTAAGGPVRLLDLDAMRASARNAYWYRWHIWQQVAAGARPAQPYWHFADRHHAEPARYSLDKAQCQYLAQPTVAAMRTYNALPNKILALPTSHLEAFQAGAHAYAHLGWLSAVPADGMLTLDGHYLAAGSGRLADQLSYLDIAQDHLTGLGSRDHLVALATQ